MGSRYVVQIRVVRNGSLFLSGLEHGAVTLGPGSDATVPTCALRRTAPLLVPGKEGLGLRLSPGLDGEVRVGERRLRVADGLLCDPRPEPLLLDDGDGGEIQLGPDLTLEFVVRRQQHQFRRWARPDAGLCAALCLSLVLVGGAVLGLAPWRGDNRRDMREKKLAKRPQAMTRLCRVDPPRPPPVAKQTEAARARPASTRPMRRRVPGRRISRPTPSAARGVLGLLARGGKKRSPLLGADATETNRLLGQLERSLTSVSGPGLGGGGTPSADDRLVGLLAAAGAEAEAALPTPGLQLRRGPKTPAQGPGIPIARAPDREAIRRVVLQGGGQVRLCYEREMLRTSRPMQGRLLLQWRIDGQGRAVEIRVLEDGVRNAALLRCVLSRIRSWSFPACPHAGCKVVYPFDFYPSAVSQS